MPLLVNAPALSGRFQSDPIKIVSGLTPGTWTTNGILPGMPWIDGNAGVTTQALGGLAARDWLSATLPWWNPDSGVGLPLAAEGQNPAFFLPFVLLLALPNGLLLLHLVLMALAGCCTFTLLRRLRLDVLPAFTAAALFELNGTFAWIAHGPALPVAFLPLMLLGLEVARTRRSAALAIGVAWSILAGFPETAALDCGFAGIWAGVRLWQAPDRAGFARRAGLAAGCGVLLAMPAIWPFLEALPREFLSVHAGAILTRLAPANLALLLFPGALGAPMAGPMALGTSNAAWLRAGGYADLVLVTLALAGLRWRGRGCDAGLRAAIGIWVLVTGARACGLQPLVSLFGVIPFLGQTNIHLYALPSWSMGLAVLAGFALQDWRDGSAMPWRRAATAAAMLTLAALLLAASDIADAWHRLPGTHALLPICLGVPLLTGAVMLAAWRGAWSAWRERLVCGAVIGNAALLFMTPQLTGTHGRHLDDGAIRAVRDHQGLGRAWSLGPLVPNYGAMFGIAEIGHNYVPVPASWVAYERDHLGGSADGVNFYPGWPPDPARLAALLPAYAHAGVSMILTPAGLAPFAPAADAPVLAYRGQVMDVWALPGAAPYWRADGCDLAPVSRLVIVARCGHAATLRRLELFWPGWSAHVGSRDAPIAATDEVFQAVSLPAGTSRVIFRYAPPGAAYVWGLVMLGSLFFFEKKNQKTFDS